MPRTRPPDPRRLAAHPNGVVRATLLLAAVAALGLALSPRLLRQRAQTPDGRDASLLVLLNPGPSSGEASLALTGFSEGCAGKTGRIDIDSRVLAPGGMAMVDLSDPGTSGLPGDCRASGIVSGSGAAFAALVLTEETLSGGGLSAYLGQTQPEAATELWLPRWSGDAADDGAASLMLMNPGAAPVDVSLELLAPDGSPLSCPACRATIAPRSAVDMAVGQLGAQTGKPIGAARVVARQVVLGLALGHPLPDRWAWGLGQGAVSPPRLPALRSRALMRSTGGSALLARGLGQGSSRLDLVATGGPAGGTLILLDPEGKAEPAVNLGQIAAGASEGLDLEAAKVAAGTYTGRLRLSGEISGATVTQWPAGKARSATGWRPEGTDLILPYFWPPDADHAAWITVAGAQDQSLTKAQVALYEPGSRKALAVAAVDLPPGGSATLDLSDETLFGKLDGHAALWATVSADLPVVATAHLLRRVAGRVVVADYEALAADALAKEIGAPWLRIGAAGPEQATPTASATLPPRATDTASPSPEPGTPTATDGPPPTATPAPTEPLLPPLPATAPPRSGPRPDPKSGWRRLIDNDSLGDAADLVRLARAADGTVWCLLRGPRGGRLVALEPGGAVRQFNDRRSAVEADFLGLIRGGSVAGFWETDPAGRIWVGGAYYNGRIWFQALPDEPQPSGILRAGDRSVMAADGRVWVPQEATVDCQRPQGCGARGLRLVDQAGGQATGIDLSGATGSPEGVQLLHLGPVTGPRSRLAGQSATDQGAEVLAVTSQALYLLPDATPILYPLLGPPPRGGLRNAGEATASYRNGQGLQVITWIEEQRLAGPRLRVYRNAWDAIGRRWSATEDLTGSGSPLTALVEAGQRVTAAVEAPDGTLWLGTDGGFLVGRRGTLWLKAQVPLTGGGDPRIRGLQMAANGQTVLLATAEGLFAFDGQDFSGQRAIHLPWLGTVRR
ncbi:MAG: hypothetical protein IPL60_08465 [Ardenticatenia bacterium]|nr:hypothetical protein [Ardenticatenia bacterium]